MTTPTTREIVVMADPREDDCLHAAEAAYMCDRPALAGWDLAPRWADEE